MGISGKTRTDPGSGLEFRLLGEFQIVSNGREVGLPASRKSRALAAYLIATAKPHRREWLCDLLWEGPEDPRGELRWSLAKIRPLLDAGETACLETDRTRIGFLANGSVVDIVVARALLTDIPSASLADLRRALLLFRGEFLDGLELPSCYRFQEWCLAERAALSALRLGALRAVIDKTSASPAEAIVHARALVAADPLSEDAHARVVGLLGRLGRRREALAQYDQARRVLERAGLPLSGDLHRARHAMGRTLATKSTSDPPPAGAATVRRITDVPLIGRAGEKVKIDALVSEAAGGQATPMLLVTGEAGIGKTRVLDHFSQRMALIGGRCLRGRAFEAEAAHPYGAWIDALRSVPLETLPDDASQLLAMLQPGLLSQSAPFGRAQFFSGIVEILARLARSAPLGVVLDDVQWLDDASSALLHHAARQLYSPLSVVFVCAARKGELVDNQALNRSIAAFRRDKRLLELPLEPLSQAETAELVNSIDRGLDAAAVYAESEGHPLFVVELSKDYRDGTQTPKRSLDAVIAAQFNSLDEECRTLMIWASALGRAFDVGLLARLTDLPTANLLAAFERGESLGIIRAVDADSYEFVHELVRGAAYRQISHPRRRLMHAEIARILEARMTADHAVAGDLVRHAGLAGDDECAARACVVAGERSLRLFANVEARSLAGRGRAHLARLPDGPARRELMIALFRIDVMATAGPGLRPLPRIVSDLTKAVWDAEAADLHAAAAMGHYLLSVLHQESGATAPAQQSTMAAAEAGRGGGRRLAAEQVANTARCLIELDADIPRARSLLAEAEALLGPRAQETCELQWGLGLLARWDGDLRESASRIDCALNLACYAEDRWRQYKCLTWLAIVSLEGGDYAAVRRRCEELRVVARQLGENEAPLADMVTALADLAEFGSSALARVEVAFSCLRTVDDKVIWPMG